MTLATKAVSIIRKLAVHSSLTFFYGSTDIIMVAYCPFDNRVLAS